MRGFKQIVGCLVAGVLAFGLLGSSVAVAAKSADELFLEKKIIARWHITGKNQIRAAQARGVDILEETPDVRQGHFNILVSADELAELRADGYQIEILNHDWYASYAAGAQIPNGGFRTLAQAVAKMDSIHTAAPTITTEKFFITISGEGNPLWVMKISDNPEVDEDEPEIFFTAMHHAREPIGMEILLETMTRLIEGYGVDTFITRLVNEREIYFLPVLNPDGYLWNESTNPNGGGLWRKNRSENWDGSRGVDLNRNYGYEWGIDDIGSSGTPGDQTYRGMAPFSEYETAGIRDFVNGRNFVFMINYHSYSNLILWPWGYDNIYTPEDDLFSAVGESLAVYNGYTPTVGWGLYLTNGDSDDWAYGASNEHAPIYSYTPEVGTYEEGAFWPDPIYIPSQIEENQGPNLVVIDLADNPYRVFGPEVPKWLGPDTAHSPNFTINWQDTGSVNPAVSYRIDELAGPFQKTDNAESAVTDWSLGGWTVSNLYAYSGTKSYYGGHEHGTKNRLTALEYRRVEPADTLRIRMRYDIELGWDYAYVEVAPLSTGAFTTIPGSVTTNSNPNGTNRGNGITGSSSGSFTLAKFSLAPYAGQDILVRISYETDGAVLEDGIWVDDIGPLQTYASVTTIETATPDTFHMFVGKANGLYLYRLQGTDGDGQKSGPHAPYSVMVVSPVNGDMSGDGFIDVVDLAVLIDHVFSGGPGAVVGGLEECNGAPGVNVLDVVYLIDFIFRGGPPPVPAP